MAMIKCPECGNEISDKAQACPKCGCPIQGETSFHDQKGHKKTIILIICAIVFVVAVIATIIVVKRIGKNNDYKHAVKLMEEGKDKEAYEEFLKLGNYKDSKKYVDDLKGPVKYEEAMDLLDLGEYEKSFEILNDISDYPEAKQVLDLIASKYEDVSDVTFFACMKLMTSFNSDEYEKTITKEFEDSIQELYKTNSDPTMGEIVEEMCTIPEIVDIVEKIKNVPESKKSDDEFKKLMLATFKMRLDYIYGKNIDDNQYNCSNYYRTKLAFDYSSDKSQYDAYSDLRAIISMVNSEVFLNGTGDVKNIAENLNSLASYTMFDKIGN